MNIDVSTLFLVTVYVESMLGLLLLFVWVQNSSVQAVAWWGAAHLLRAASISLFGMYGDWPNIVTIDLANAILLTSFAVTWTGARVFDGRKPMPLAMVAGAVIWLSWSRLDFVHDDMEVRALLSAAIIAGYTWMATVEFLHGRAEPLVSRFPAIFLFFAHGALFLLRTPLATFLPWSASNRVFGSVWLTVLSSEALLFSISIAFILLAMAKERAEFRHKTASMVDQLTGVANRRGFTADCAKLAAAQAERPKPTAVLVADLDHFKSINDRFGHNIGDRVIVAFADTAKAALCDGDVIGRLGGEEFALVLRDVGPEQALRVADAIRTSFADVAATIEGRPVYGTASLGLVVSSDPVLDLGGLMQAADQALYRAKERGRNRVEVASAEPRTGADRFAGFGEAIDKAA